MASKAQPHLAIVRSLADSYAACISGFREFSTHLARPDCRVICRQQVSLNAVTAEYGKLLTWGEQSRAVLPAHARGSLEEQVRESGRVGRVISNTLQQLEELLKMAVLIAKTSNSSDEESESSLSASSDSDDFDTSPPDRATSGQMKMHRKVSKISVIVNHVSEQIKALYNTSALLRRPVLTDKYLRSNRPDEIEDPSEQPMKIFDKQHVREKVLQWSRDWKAANGDGSTDFDESTTVLLQWRLVEATVRRRKQIQYWIHHTKKAPISAAVGHPLPEAAVVMQPGLEIVGVVPKDEPTAPSTVPAAVPATVSSGVTKVTFSTVAITEAHEAPSEAVPRTIYAESNIGKTQSSAVPSVPRIKDWSTDFPCPYCGSMLETNQMRNRRTWKRHVYRDLRPYICTFQDCASANRLYHTRHDWIYHETQMHRRQWVCPDPCSQSFRSQGAMTEHIRDTHPEDMGVDQLLPLVLRLTERPIAEDSIERCPLCPIELQMARLLDHIAEHLEEVSLFALPHQFEESSNSSIDSNDARGKGASLVSEDALSDLSSFKSQDDASINTGKRELETTLQDHISGVASENIVEQSTTNEPELSVAAVDWTSIYDSTRRNHRGLTRDPILAQFRLRQHQLPLMYKNRLRLSLYIGKHMAQTRFLNETQDFLPSSGLDKVATLEFISHVVQTLLRTDDASVSEDLVREIRAKRCKMFLACVFSGAPIDALTSLGEYGDGDDQMPLSLFESGLRPEFFYHQRHFLPAFFAAKSFQRLDWDHTVPISLNTTDFVGTSTFGTVYKAFFHPDQHSLPGRTATNEYLVLASFHDVTREHICKESVQAPQHDHIVPCLASFSYTRQLPWLFMIYARPHQSLEEFMQMQTSNMTDAGLLQQFIGLASALRAAAAAWPNMESNQETVAFAYFMMSPTPQTVMVSADDLATSRRFSLAPYSKIREISPNSAVLEQTHFMYIPPEHWEDGHDASSPAGDVWSLGMLFFEMMVWHLDGYASLDRVRRAATDAGTASWYISGALAAHQSNPYVSKMRRLLFHMTSTRPADRPTEDDVVHTLLRIAAKLKTRIPETDTGPLVVSASDPLIKTSLRTSEPELRSHGSDVSSDTEVSVSGLIV